VHKILIAPVIAQAIACTDSGVQTEKRNLLLDSKNKSGSLFNDPKPAYKRFGIGTYPGL